MNTPRRLAHVLGAVLVATFATPAVADATPATAQVAVHPSLAHSEPTPRIAIDVTVRHPRDPSYSAYATRVRLTRAQVTPGGVIFRLTTSHGRRDSVDVDVLERDRSYSRAQLVRDVQTVGLYDFTDPEVAPALRRLNREVTFYGGTSSFPDRSTHQFAIDLPAGRYDVATSLTDLTARPVFTTLRVSRRPEQRHLPQVGGTFESFGRHLTAPRRLPASGWVAHENSGSDIASLDTEMVRPRASMEEIRRYFRRHGQTATPFDFDPTPGTAFLSPGRTFQVKYRIRPGRAVVASHFDRVSDGDRPCFHGAWDSLRFVRS